MLKGLFWVFLLSASPIAELRGGIPLGVFVLKLPLVLVCLAAVLGNFLIVPFLLIFLRYFSDFLMHRFYFFNRLLNYVFSKTRDGHAHRFDRWEHWALLILVAIPLPLTGAWTGSVAAFLFGIPFRRTLWVILLGIIIAGLIVASLSLLGNGVAHRL